MSLDFGIFYEIELEKPFGERSEYDVFQQTIDQVVLAEQVGFTHFWTVEHHFLSEFSHCSAPEVLYGAISQRTKTIRIGHGVRLLPFPYNHPIRVAEMAATVDLLSNGRLEFGTGRSISRDELEGFGVNPADTRILWEEALEIVVGAWTEERFSHHGKNFDIPEREVVPKPLQRPHPPLWCASTSAEGCENAGRKGLGLLAFTLMTPLEELERRINLYRGGIAEAEPIGKFVNDRVGTFTMVHVADTEEEAKANAREAMLWYIRTSFNYIASIGTWLDDKLGSYEYIKQFLNVDINALDFDFLNDNAMVIAGTPDQCAEKVARYRDVGCDQFLAFMQIRGIPHAKVTRSIELFGKHVIPQFR